MELMPANFWKFSRNRLARIPDVSLQWKLGLPILCGLLLLFGLFVVLGELLTDDTARSMAAERLSVARLTARFFDRQFDQQFKQLEWVASRINVESPGGSAEAQHWGISESFVSSVFLVDNTGQLVWADPPDALGPDQELAAESFLREPLITSERYASPVFADPSTLQPTAVFAVPVAGSDGAPRAVLAATVDASDSMFRVLMAAAGELGDGGHAELVDQNLRLVASNERGHALRPGEHPSFYGPLLQKHESAVGLTDPIGDEDPQDRGQRHIMAFVPLERVPWGVGLGGSESVFTALSARWRSYTLPLGVVAFGIALFMVWITRRSVIGPVKALTSVSQRIASGDLTTPIPISGEGEVRILAKALDDMRRRLQEAQDSEAELSRRKDEFLAIASHELRTPVAALTALTQLQRSRLARGQQISDHQALGQIHEQLERLARLVAQLLDSSRVQMGKVSLNRQPSDLSRLVEEAALAVQVADAPDRVVEVSAPPSVPAVVDPLRIGQVLINLLENAVKHSPHGAPVHVDLYQLAPGTVRITVRDHGAGISPAQRAHVFDRYFQEPGPEGSASSSGLGLGLYVSREIVELHSGEITVESPPGGGTLFIVTLPTGVTEPPGSSLSGVPVCIPRDVSPFALADQGLTRVPT
jgi:signal transduction histidine kinase